jgi:hypothetical protein
MAFVFAPIASILTYASDFDAFPPLLDYTARMYINTASECTNEPAKSRRSLLFSKSRLILSFSSSTFDFFSLKNLVYSPSRLRLSRLDPSTWDFYAFCLPLAAALPLVSPLPPLIPFSQLYLNSQAGRVPRFHYPTSNTNAALSR